MGLQQRSSGIAWGACLLREAHDEGFGVKGLVQERSWGACLLREAHEEEFRVQGLVFSAGAVVGGLPAPGDT